MTMSTSAACSNHAPRRPGSTSTTWSLPSLSWIFTASTPSAKLKRQTTRSPTYRPVAMMRSFHDGDEIWVEPFRAGAVPIIKDLVVNRSALDRVVASGGFVSICTGGAPDGNAIPVSKNEADLSMDAAACIGCGACVAACKNGSAMLFLGAQVSKYLHLPQGQAERSTRVANMINQADAEGFGACSNYTECEAVCPKEIPVRVIAETYREYTRSVVQGKALGQSGAAKDDGA